MSTIKQVIVIRKDLKMRRGKEIAQGSHASMAFLVARAKVEGGVENMAQHVWSWLNGMHTKICLRVSSENELQDIYNQAKASGLEAHMIVDAGATEFHGVPTKTCLAIGPDYSEKIDPITKDLELY